VVYLEEDEHKQAIRKTETMSWVGWFSTKGPEPAMRPLKTSNGDVKVT